LNAASQGRLKGKHSHETKPKHDKTTILDYMRKSQKMAMEQLVEMKKIEQKSTNQEQIQT
jgi:hypothetical protein